jgi:hypothetical protein
LDDSTAIIKWSAMAKSRADNGEGGSRVERRSVKSKHDSVENVLYAVGMVRQAP